MRVREFLKALPESPAKREEAIVSAVRAGHVAPIDWREVQSEIEGHRAILWVSGDALRIGDADDSVRISMTARSAQVIADLLGCILPTTRICDLIWEQATVRIPPCSQKLPPAMVDGVRRDLVEVLQDPALSALVSDEEPPCIARLPAVPPPS